MQSNSEFSALSAEEQYRIKRTVGPRVMRDRRYWVPFVLQLLVFVALLQLVPQGEWRIWILAAYIAPSSALLIWLSQHLTREYIAAHMSAIIT